MFNGIVAHGFGPSPANRRVALALLPNDDLVSAVSLDQGNGDILLQRISDSNGTAVTGCGDGFGFRMIDMQPAANAARDTVVALAAQPDGRPLVLGQSCTSALGCLPAAARLTASTGQRDTRFCASTACVNASVAGANRGRRVVRDLQIQGQTVVQMAVTVGLRDDAGRFVLGGRATLGSGAALLLFTRLLADGDLDASFGAPTTPGYQSLGSGNPPLSTSALLRDGSGRMVVGGESTMGGLRRIVVARLGSDGQPDLGFGGGNALLEYFVSAPAEDHALRAPALDGTRVLGLGDYAGPASRDAFLFRIGGDVGGLFTNGFEG